MHEAQKLRDLAAWYRAFAERAGNPAIWDARLRTADDLEKEAASLEQRSEPYFVREPRGEEMNARETKGTAPITRGSSVQ